MDSIINPKAIPLTNKIILDNPVALKDRLNNIVDIIKPVFRIYWEYLSVYWNDIRSINTSTKIKMVKKSMKKR